MFHIKGTEQKGLYRILQQIRLIYNIKEVNYFCCILILKETFFLKSIEMMCFLSPHVRSQFN